MLGVPDPTVANGVRPSLGIMGVYSRDPLLLVYEDDHSELGKVVTYQLNLHAMAALDFGSIAKLHVDVPFMASQDGNAPVLNGTQAAAPDSAVMGDVRTGLRFALVQQRAWVPSIAVNANVWFPSGNDNSFTGSGSTRYALELITGADHNAYLWRIALGRRFGHDASSLAGMVASDATLSAGAAVRFGPAWVGPELHGSTSSGNGIDAFGRSSTQFETLLTAGARLGSFTFGAGAGGGLTRGIGTPSFRGLLTIAFSPEVNWASAAAEREQQSVERKREQENRARQAAENATRAPVLVREHPTVGGAIDTDGDGVPDDVDECPTIVGPRTGPRPGCPLDTDGDGIPDIDDRCPTVPGVPNDNPALHGCPADTDGDGIIDAEDACPTERGVRTNDPKTHGCPEAVRIVGTQIVISDTILFATAQDAIAPESDGLLLQIVHVLEDHPEIARVAVDGHTDNVGLESNNLALSRRRAVAVVRWLVAHGIDERRLEARGFGPRRPLVSNDTPEGRSRNRRVEFQILRRTPLGASDWKDGGVAE